MADSQAKIKVTADVKDAKSNLSSLEKAGKSLKDNFLKLAAAGASVGYAIYDSIQAFLEQEKAVNRLNAAISNMPGATAETSKNLQDLAANLQQTTVYGDDTTIAMMGLTASLGMNEKEIMTLTPMIQNMATALGMDLSTAGQLVAKVMAGQTGALGRYGIEVKKSADGTVELSSMVQALSRFSGMAAAEANTFGGKIKQIKELIGDFKEEIGETILKAISPLINYIKIAAQVFFNLSPAAKQVILGITGIGAAVAIALPIIGGLAITIGAISAPVLIVISALATLASGFMIIKTNIWGLGDAIKDFGKLLFDIVEGPLQIWINVIKRVMEGDFKGAISAIPEHLDKIKKGFADLGASSSKAVDNMSASWDGLKTKVSEIKAQMAVPATVAPGNVPTKDMPSGSAMPNPEMEAEKAALNLEQLYVYKEAEQEILAEWDLTDQERKIIQDQADKDRSLAMDEFLKMNYADRARMLQSNLSSENAAKLLKESEALKNKKLTNEELKKEEIALYNKYAELREQDKQDNYTLLKLKAGDQASFDNMMVSGMHSKYAAMRAIGKAFAIRNAIQDTYSAALGGYKAMVGIPIVGPGLAIAAAAAASAFGMARVAEIASAAEGGVVMPKGGGQLVQVAEAGAPEAIIPLGDKRAENIMGSSGVTVNLHVGAFMGNESDAMAFAKMIDENLYKAKLAGETISI